VESLGVGITHPDEPCDVGSIIVRDDSVSVPSVGLSVLVWLQSRGAVVGNNSPASMEDVLMAGLGCTRAVVEGLHCMGAVVVRADDDFGETVVEMVATSLEDGSSLSLVVEARSSVKDFAFTDVGSASSKIMLVLELHRQTWVARNDVLVPFVRGGPLVYLNNMLMRSHVYLRALIANDSLFDKNAPFILHNMPEGYYKCLLSLDDLGAVFHGRADFQELRNKDFERLARGDDVIPGAPALEDDVDEGAAAIEDDDVELAIALADAVPAPLAMRPSTIALHGRQVNFDGCSHQSGRQRGYITCSRNSVHNGCHKYRFVDEFETREHCASWLLAWSALAAATDDRREHYAMVPSDDALTRVLRRL
jgi:hypothetical protein